MTRPGALQAAISALGAVEVAPGRYAWQMQSAAQSPLGYYSYGEPHWVTGDGAALYAVHAQGGSVRTVPLPQWWTPERRFAMRQRERNGEGALWTGATREEMQALKNRFDVPTGAKAATNRVITADLNTGEEIPA